jgi:uncharacterized protein (DUF1499 family)
MGGAEGDLRRAARRESLGVSYRLPPLEPSRLAPIADRLAWGAVGVMAVAILTTRSGQVPAQAGIALVTLAVVLAAASVAVALVAGIEIWRHGRLGLGRLFRALIVSALLLAWPAWLAAQALRLPSLTDITTDIADPPVFSTRPATIAARSGIRPPDVESRRRAVQAEAYPAVRTLVLESEPEEAFQLVLKAVRALKWRVIEEVRPDDRRGLGRIEAIDETRLLRLRDDITIRFRWTGSETRVDIRSVSRVGRHDLGANAERILRLIEAVNNPEE